MQITDITGTHRTRILSILHKALHMAALGELPGNSEPLTFDFRPGPAVVLTTQSHKLCLVLSV